MASEGPHGSQGSDESSRVHRAWAGPSDPVFAPCRSAVYTRMNTRKGAVGDDIREYAERRVNVEVVGHSNRPFRVSSRPRRERQTGL
jgi:hypothetical protein